MLSGTLSSARLLTLAVTSITTSGCAGVKLPKGSLRVTSSAPAGMVTGASPLAANGCGKVTVAGVGEQGAETVKLFSTTGPPPTPTISAFTNLIPSQFGQ